MLKAKNGNKAAVVLGVSLVLLLTACVSTPYKGIHPKQLTDDQLVQELSDVYLQLNVSTANLQMLRQAMLPPAYRVDSTSFTNIYLYTTLIGNTAYTTGTAHTTTNYTVTDENQLANSMNQLGQSIQRSRITTLLQRGQALEYEVVRRAEQRQQGGDLVYKPSVVSAPVRVKAAKKTPTPQLTAPPPPEPFVLQDWWYGTLYLGGRAINVQGALQAEGGTVSGTFKPIEGDVFELSLSFSPTANPSDTVLGTVTFGRFDGPEANLLAVAGSPMEATGVAEKKKVRVWFSTAKNPGEPDANLWLYPKP